MKNRDLGFLLAGAALAAPPPARPQHVDVRIEERRAPTVESARLLRELQEEARQSVVATISAPDNVLKLEGRVFHFDYLADTQTVVVKFALNGRECTVEVKVNRWLTPQECADKIFNAVCERMTREVLASLLSVIRSALGVPA